ncbi:unnamed protein product, partial [Amoebophrya sp. A25]
EETPTLPIGSFSLMIHIKRPLDWLLRVVVRCTPLSSTCCAPSGAILLESGPSPSTASCAVVLPVVSRRNRSQSHRKHEKLCCVSCD